MLRALRLAIAALLAWPLAALELKPDADGDLSAAPVPRRFTVRSHGVSLTVVDASGQVSAIVIPKGGKGSIADGPVIVSDGPVLVHYPQGYVGIDEIDGAWQAHHNEVEFFADGRQRTQIEVIIRADATIEVRP